MVSAVADETGLVLDLRTERGGSVLATEPVRSGDLQEVVAELWWRGYLRRGAFTVDARDIDVRLEALPQRGFLLRTTGAEGRETSLTCSVAALHPVAQRGAAELVRRGVLREADTFYYELRALFETPKKLERSERPETTATPRGTLLSRSRDTSFETLCLAALLESSRLVGAAPPGDHQLFYTETALQRAESISRRGEQTEPAVESGGILLGLLGWCPDAQDAFVWVVDALEAPDADQREFSLSFSSKTWSCLQAVVRARRAQPGEGALRIVGQTHGHPFSPGEPCAACPETPDCPKHTAFLSEDDHRWSRAVFAGQPWQVGHMWGINARGEPTTNVYGLCGGRLERRGYRLLAADDLSRIRQASTTQGSS